MKNMLHGNNCICCERFLRVKKTTMEATVKLVAPLVVFIFPAIFIILGFPIAMKFLNEGLF